MCLGSKWSQWYETVEKQNATDGDLYRLFFNWSYKQWLIRRVEYQEQAKKSLMISFNTITMKSDRCLTAGNWANKDSDYYYLMWRPIIFSHYFQSFYDLTGNKQWLGCYDKMFKQLEQISLHSDTGPLPDFTWAEKSRPLLMPILMNLNTWSVLINACRLPYHLVEPGWVGQNSFKRWWISLWKSNVFGAGGDLEWICPQSIPGR